MILIAAGGDWKFKFDPANQTKEAYEKTLKEFQKLVLPSAVKSIKATGVHLEQICERFAGIPVPRPVDPSESFIWVGVFAETIVANILNSLYNGDSFIIRQVQDIHDYNDWHPRDS